MDLKNARKHSTDILFVLLLFLVFTSSALGRHSAWRESLSEYRFPDGKQLYGPDGPCLCDGKNPACR